MPESAVAGSTLGELAVRFGCSLRGDPAQRITAVATLAGGPASLGFLANPALLGELRATRLGAVILAPAHAAECPEGSAALIHANPHATFARVATLLHAEGPLSPGIHSTAQVHAQAQVAASAEIGAFAVIEAGAVIGARCRVGAHTVIGERTTLGADTRIGPRVVVLQGCSIGARCIVHPGAVIGSDGFGNARDGAAWVKVPQLGAVRIGDDVEIGANTTIDRGALDDTLVGDGVRIDNLVQVAHNVTIGAHTAIAACVAIAGSTHIGQRCMIGGGAGFSGQLRVGDDIVIGGFAQVTHSLARPGFYSSAMPVEEMGVWSRLLGRFKRLETLNARVRKLETAARSAAGTGQEDDDKH